MMEELTVGISVLGFSSLISLMVYQSKKNSELISSLCERIAKLEGILQEHLKWVAQPLLHLEQML